MTKAKSNRIEVIDSLRGFAVMGIMLLHSIEHFNFYKFPDASTQPDWLNKLDTGVWDTLFFLFGGKGYAIFALLFGFTFGLMFIKQQEKGYDFGYRFMWRMVLLLGFAFINGAFFPGEVLLLYALVGGVLFLVRHQSNKILLIISIFLLSQPLEWGRIVYHAFDQSYVLPAKESSQYWAFLKAGQVQDSILELFKSNTLYGHKVGLLWAYEVGRMVQSAGLFVLGFLSYKEGILLPSPKNTKTWQKTLLISSLILIPLHVLEIHLRTSLTEAFDKRTLLPLIDMWGNLAFVAILVSGFILVSKIDYFYNKIRGLRYIGRMSLTAYVMQSIIGSFIFYGYGLGLGPHVLHTVSFSIGIILFIIQYFICRWWIIKYKQGPLEKLWHKLTWIGTNKK